MRSLQELLEHARAVRRKVVHWPAWKLRDLWFFDIDPETLKAVEERLMDDRLKSAFQRAAGDARRAAATMPSSELSMWRHNRIAEALKCGCHECATCKRAEELRKVNTKIDRLKVAISVMREHGYNTDGLDLELAQLLREH